MGSPSRSTTSAAHPLSTASASKRIPTSPEEKQHTGSYRHHLHLLVSGVFPSFLFNHTSIAFWSTDIVQLHSTLYYIPSSTLTLSLFTKHLIRDFCTLINCLLAPFEKYTHSMCYLFVAAAHKCIKTFSTEQAMHILQNVVFCRFLWKSQTKKIFCVSVRTPLGKESLGKGKNVTGNKNVCNLHKLGGSEPLASRDQENNYNIFLPSVK